MSTEERCPGKIPCGGKDEAGAGADDDAEDFVVIATHGPGNTLFFDTDFSLNQAGAQIAHKLNAVLTTGNEAGSATMPVQRPF